MEKENPPNPKIEKREPPNPKIEKRARPVQKSWFWDIEGIWPKKKISTFFFQKYEEFLVKRQPPQHILENQLIFYSKIIDFSKKCWGHVLFRFRKKRWTRKDESEGGGCLFLQKVHLGPFFPQNSIFYQKVPEVTLFSKKNSMGHALFIFWEKIPRWPKNLEKWPRWPGSPKKKKCEQGSRLILEN